jgi:hypothetical protein
MEAFCKYFAEEKERNSFEVIEKKRKKIMDMVESKVGVRVTVANIRKIMTHELMMSIIEKIDHEFFENRLLKTFRDNNCVITTCLENRCTRVAGRCEFKMARGDSCNRITIKMMSKVFIESFKKTSIKQRAVDGVKCDNILECFIMTLCHELTHAIVFCNCVHWDKTDSGAGNWTGETRSGNGHSKTFMSILFNVFGHTKYTHNLRNGIVIMEPDERKHKIEELSVDDKIIANVTFRGKDEQVKFLAKIIEIKKIKGNNIVVKALEPGESGNIYQIGIHHVVKVLDAEGKAKPKPPSPVKPKSPEKKTKKASEQSKTKTNKRTGDTLLKNLEKGDEVILNARLPGNAARSTLLVQILDVNRRKKTKQVRIKVLDEGQYKNKILTVNDTMIVAKPDNKVLAASPRTGRDMAFTYFGFSSIPFTENPVNFTDKINAIDVGEVGSNLLDKINALQRFNWPANKKPSDKFPDGFKIKQGSNGHHFIVKTRDGKLILGDSYGSNNIMAGIRLEGAKLKSLIRDVHGDYKDIWPVSVKKTIKVKREKSSVDVSTRETKKNDCTKRNPAPPCGEGMIEKKRPNGSTCCYKGTKPVQSTTTQKKQTQPVKPQVKRSVDFRYISDRLDFISKPYSIKDLEIGNYDKLEPSAKKYIDKLPRLNWNKDFELDRRDTFKESDPEHFVLSVGGEYILVDRQGFDHVRYAVVIRNLPSSGKKMKDVFKEMCTPRNPEPPCGSGMIEKKRPNGAMCCYKDK